MTARRVVLRMARSGDGSTSGFGGAGPAEVGEPRIEVAHEEGDALGRPGLGAGPPPRSMSLFIVLSRWVRVVSTDVMADRGIRTRRSGCHSRERQLGVGQHEAAGPAGLVLALALDPHGRGGRGPTHLAGTSDSRAWARLRRRRTMMITITAEITIDPRRIQKRATEGGR